MGMAKDVNPILPAQNYASTGTDHGSCREAYLLLGQTASCCRQLRPPTPRSIQSLLSLARRVAHRVLELILARESGLWTVASALLRWTAARRSSGS